MFPYFLISNVLIDDKPGLPLVLLYATQELVNLSAAVQRVSRQTFQRFCSLEALLLHSVISCKTELVTTIICLVKLQFI